eukprot:TRINITY_DN24575_c0_g1_i1.p1 TRINITY_DN24575_c0_g1~~TRINITY_DN24575_c0_g1_i1.p1  ORF type:complete len:325 (+),score=23.90 TRINITY_DN24575_c0_g1_i1:272-1246(+)
MGVPDRAGRRLLQLSCEKTRNRPGEVKQICSRLNRKSFLTAGESCAAIGVMARNNVVDKVLIKKCSSTLKRDPKAISTSRQVAEAIEGFRTLRFLDSHLYEILAEEIRQPNSPIHYSKISQTDLLQHMYLSETVSSPVLQVLLLSEVLPRYLSTLPGTDLVTIAASINRNHTHARRQPEAITKALVAVAQTVISKEVIYKTLTVEEWSFVVGMLALIYDVRPAVLPSDLVNRTVTLLMSQVSRPSLEASLVLYPASVLSSIAVPASAIPMSDDLKRKVVTWADRMLEVHFGDKMVPAHCLEGIEFAKRRLGVTKTMGEDAFRSV